MDDSDLQGDALLQGAKVLNVFEERGFFDSPFRRLQGLANVLSQSLGLILNQIVFLFFPLDKGKVVENKLLMYPSDHIQHILFFVILGRGPLPPFVARDRHQNFDSSHHCLIESFLVTLASKDDVLFVGFEQGIVWIFDKKCWHFTGQFFGKHHKQLEGPFQVMQVNSKLNLEAYFRSVNLRFVQEVRVFEGRFCLGVLFDDLRVKVADLLRTLLGVIRIFHEVSKPFESGQHRHPFILLLLQRLLCIWIRPPVTYDSIVPLIQGHYQFGIQYLQEMQTLKQRLQKLQLEKDPYQLLESEPTEDFAQVKKKYRALALKYHPDRNKDEEATKIFIQISRAYEFLEKEQNRQLYAIHIKAMAEEKERIERMDQERKILIQNLKRREEEKAQRKEDLAAELRRRKEFFQRMEKQQEDRQNLRREIQNQMNPKQFYEKLSSIEVRWEKGLSFTSSILEAYFSGYGEVTKVTIEPKRRQATVVVSSIEKASQIVQQFNHPMIRIQLAVKGNDRSRLLGALQKRRAGGDFSLSTENIERLKEMLNRDSNLFLATYNAER